MLLEKREVRKNTACRFFCYISKTFALSFSRKRQKNLAENENETLP